MKKIRVAIIGVGNCASALIQGIQYYKDLPEESDVPGLMHPILGGYSPGDIEFSAAFDIHADKVGRDLSEAILVPPNNTVRFAEVPSLGVTVDEGMPHDGVGRYLKPIIPVSCRGASNVAKVLRETGTDVVINYLPVGSEAATRWYVEQVLEARCALVNCIPVFVASQPYWQRRFEALGLPVIGDDIKSQLGATIVHRVLTDLFEKRGIKLERTYQLNFGGNADFLNMLERDRLESKKISKTQAVTSQLRQPVSPQKIHVGPSDYVAWLEDRKFCHIRLEGIGFGGTSLNCELKLEVCDSPNSAGVVIDAIRCAKLALDRGIGGALTGPASYFMKTPPVQYTDHEARRLTEEFIHPECRSGAAGSPEQAEATSS